MSLLSGVRLTLTIFARQVKAAGHLISQLGIKDLAGKASNCSVMGRLGWVTRSFKLLNCSPLYPEISSRNNKNSFDVSLKSECTNLWIFTRERIITCLGPRSVLEEVQEKTGRCHF